jgi:putative iron-regulated protein
MRLLGCVAAAAVLAGQAWAAEPAAVVATYADIAEAGYGDSLAAAERLGAAVEALIAAPSAEALQAAKARWLEARVPYQQTEAFRFGNPIVDGWEGKVNAWPLDEGLIDYVDARYGGATDENPYADLNVIANTELTLSGGTVDAGEITPASWSVKSAARPSPSAPHCATIHSRSVTRRSVAASR